MVAVFCCALPAVACASVYLLKPGFTVKRTLSPALGRVGSPVAVTLDVHGRTPGGGRTMLVEDLPVSFRDVPRFSHPRPVAPRSLLSRYNYTLHPAHRGIFTIGPLSGQFADPFNVSSYQRGLDDGARLTVAPAAVELPAISLSDGRGHDGSHSTPELAHASQDDAMTREYRYGDPLRRVHWAVTASQGKLMVRAEESVTTPEAALVLDLRSFAFGERSRAIERFQIAGHSMVGLPELRTTALFETAIVAAASIATHLLERGYVLRVLDHRGLPGFSSSTSAADPGVSEYSGIQGVFDVATALAALELNETTDAPSLPFANELVHKLHEGRRRGPLVAIVGILGDGEAHLLAQTAESTQSAFAMILCPDPELADPALSILRRAGWHATALTPAMSLEQAWLQLSQPSSISGRRS